MPWVSGPVADIQEPMYAHVYLWIPVPPSPGVLSRGRPILTSQLWGFGQFASSPNCTSSVHPHPFPSTHTQLPPGLGCPSSHVHCLPQLPSRVQHKSHPGSGWVPMAAPLLHPLRPGSPGEQLLRWLGAGSCLSYVALTFLKFLLPAFSNGRFHIKIPIFATY